MLSTATEDRYSEHYAVAVVGTWQGAATLQNDPGFVASQEG